MIIGVGIDLADQQRMQRALHRHGEKFLQRLFSEQEIVFCQRYRSPIEHYAGKFAVKEAFLKAIGMGLGQQVTFRQLEVLNRPSGAPFLTTHGRAAEVVMQLGVTHTHVSLSHSSHLAIAVVILERR